MPRGGYRKPDQPAAVSGPGKLSKRTDGGPTQVAQAIPSSGQYGARKDMAELQSSAAMAGNPEARVTPAMPSTPLTGLFDDSQRPDEAVTAGSPVGAGPGTEAMSLPQRTFNPVDTLSRLAANDPSGQVESILQDLSSRGIQ